MREVCTPERRTDVDRLLLEEVRFMRGWIDEAFSSKSLTFRKQDGTRRLSRSYLWGSLIFGDGEQFIRYETSRERKRRPATVQLSSSVCGVVAKFSLRR